MTILYSPFPFAIRCTLEQSASGLRRLPLPPPGLSREEKEKGKDLSLMMMMVTLH